MLGLLPNPGNRPRRSKQIALNLAVKMLYPYQWQAGHKSKKTKLLLTTFQSLEEASVETCSLAFCDQRSGCFHLFLYICFTCLFELGLQTAFKQCWQWIYSLILKNLGKNRKHLERWGLPSKQLISKQIRSKKLANKNQKTKNICVGHELLECSLCRP